MKKFLTLAIVAALLGCAESASAQIFGGWFRFGVCPGGTCQRCQQTASAKQTTKQAACETCSDGSCLADPVNREVEPADEYKSAPVQDVEPCEPVETAETCDCPLNEIETELVKEICRVRGRSLAFDLGCCRRAQLNTACQTNWGLGHWTGDPNEVAGRGYTSARAAVAGWLNSAPHRAILLRGNYTKIGACVRRGRDGLLYWSVNFGY